MVEKVLLEQMSGVFSHFPSIRRVYLFGSRAKGTHKPMSDIDLAIVGCDDMLFCERVAAVMLADLPTLYGFDVVDYDHIHNARLKDHIDRVGIEIYHA